jgi:hypothetical protein
MSQTDWRWCSKCQGLWFAGNGTPASRCPSDGNHSLDSTALKYSLETQSSGNDQGVWFWCTQCQGLWYGGNPLQSPSHCPANQNGSGTHSEAGSGQYFLKTPPVSGQEGGWRLCNQCQGLFQASHFTTGDCPALMTQLHGGGHNYQGSGEYGLSGSKLLQ